LPRTYPRTKIGSTTNWSGTIYSHPAPDNDTDTFY
jgi:hypothetical protein